MSLAVEHIPKLHGILSGDFSSVREPGSDLYSCDLYTLQFVVPAAVLHFKYCLVSTVVTGAVCSRSKAPATGLPRAFLPLLRACAFREQVVSAYVGYGMQCDIRHDTGATAHL